jgi:hypothetical protein
MYSPKASDLSWRTHPFLSSSLWGVENFNGGDCKKQKSHTTACGDLISVECFVKHENFNLVSLIGSNWNQIKRELIGMWRIVNEVRTLTPVIV